MRDAIFSSLVLNFIEQFHPSHQNHVDITVNLFALGEGEDRRVW